jgi:Asp-tRNA(Asn)/Glu-tRNA(Gln) amidotransferase C subunit
MSGIRATARIGQNISPKHCNANISHILLRLPSRNRISSRTPPIGSHLGIRPVSTSALRQTASRTEPSATTHTAFDPLNPQIETDEFGLPLQPLTLPAEIFNPPPTRITSAHLQRLHKMAAIAPPAAGSEEETEMLRDLEGLLGLMDQVKRVKLDDKLVERAAGSAGGEVDEEQMKVNRKEAIRKLLVSGNYADPSVIFDGSRIDEAPLALDDIPGHQPVVGKGLLAWRAEPMEK